ncbi:MAG: hypothetical protein IAE94_06505 [Chthoniobacterales bacterium]|nr:hypothetical protein [Chthoniobacterales bacterium]
MKKPKLHPSDELTILTHQVGALRRYIIRQRTSLPSPGYHLDLTAEAAEKTRKFLAELPGKCRILLAALSDFQKRTAPGHFKDSSEYLQNLADDPGMIFRVSTMEIFEGLRADAEILASIGLDPEPLNGMEPTLC